MQDLVKDTVPVKVVTDAGKVFSSYRRMCATDAVKKQAKVGTLLIHLYGQLSNVAKAQACAKERDRIEKNKRLRKDRQARKVYDAEAERKRIWNEAEKMAVAYQRNAPARATLRLEADQRKKRYQPVSKPPVITRTITETQPKRDYMTKVRALHPASDDPDERMKRTSAMLESILGPERMNAGVGLPSGHSGINNDPVLTKHNHEQFINHTLSLHHEYQTIQRQQWEAEQRNAAEKEAERQRKAILLDHYWSEYVQQVANLAQFGSSFCSTITYLLQAFDEGNLDALHQGTVDLINNVLIPSNNILEEMKKAIMLETMGAQSLSEAWPVNDVDRLLTVLDAQTLSQFTEDFQNTLGYMLQGLRAICQPILTAVPFENPLNEQPPPLFQAAPIPITFKDYAKQKSQQSQQPNQPYQLLQTQQQTQDAVAPEDDNAGKNFGSFADLMNATKGATQGNNQTVPSINIIPPSFTVPAPTVNSTLPSFTVPGTTSSTAQTPQVQALTKYMNDQILDIQDNIDNFLKGGYIPVGRRRGCEEVLQWIYDHVQGATGILTANDSPLMKTTIEIMIRKITNMKNAKERSKKTTRDLEVLANRVVKIWA
jgi:hypothetical protein